MFNEHVPETEVLGSQKWEDTTPFSRCSWLSEGIYSFTLAGALIEEWKWLRGGDILMLIVIYLFLHLIISTWENLGLLLGMGKWPSDLVLVWFLLTWAEPGVSLLTVESAFNCAVGITAAPGCELWYARVLCKQWTIVRRCEHWPRVGHTWLVGVLH